MTADNPFAYPASAADKASAQRRAFEWAAMITDRPEIQGGNTDLALNALMSWWTGSAEEVSRKVPGLPDPFRTTRFRKEIRYIESPLTALKPAFDSLRAAEASFFEAMDHVGRNFAWDAQRLQRWKEGMESLSALAAWSPAFMRALDYLTAALPLGREEIDHSRESLLRFAGEPCRFLQAKARQEFEKEHLEFKKSYADAYCSLHEEALHIVSGFKKDDAKIDPVLLRNLDLLSGLQHMDKSYVNRVKLLAKWVQRNQCNLPVRQILERYPRCYCNFNPCSRQQPADSAAQINGIIRDGIEYYRTLLRKCARMITAELKTQEFDSQTAQSVAALLGSGPVSSLKPQTIKALNRIISKYPNEFLAEIRKKQA